MLTTLDTQQLVWHEELEHPRLRALVELVRANHSLPPIAVVPAGESFLIIDGAHRARAAAVNGRTVRARVHELDPSIQVPGWSHALSPANSRRLTRRAERPRPGSCAAALDFDAGRLNLEHHDGSPAAVHRALHAVADTAYHHGHLRLEPGVLLPPGCGVLTWSGLPLATIIEVAATIGPLPAGVTRFASLIRRPSR